MPPKYYKKAISIRGDCLYCPLPLSVDSYWNCLTNCHHCYMRRLNHVWGTDLRPANPEDVRKQLENGLKNPKPKSSLAWALKLKKTIRLGNKTDPYQDAELDHKVTRKIIQHLVDLQWSFVIQTRFPSRIFRDLEIMENHFRPPDQKFPSIIFMPVISPGMERDWEILERKRTEPIHERFKTLEEWTRKKIPYGVNGEPFIPGFHTVKEFQKMCQFLRSVGCVSYNTYNFHFNDYVAKRLHSIGIDIERIWYHNQDTQWKKILAQLLQIAKDHDIRLGCPDFVNTGWDWTETSNTCCGLNVPRPSKFNTHYFKLFRQCGWNDQEIEEETFEGIGDQEQGKIIIKGKGPCEFYTLGDVGK